MTGTRTRIASLARYFAFQVTLVTAIAAFVGPAHAVVKIFDGFGDADLNNNGVAAESNDSDISGGGGGAVGTYIALANGGTPLVFPTDTTINEVTAAQDSSDVGIKWYSMGQWTGTAPNLTPRASIHVINDAAGVLPETNPSIGFYHSASGTTDHAEAINSGLALAVECKGRTQPATGFFGQQIALGPQVNDEFKVSFDFRIWYSAPNFNTNALNHIPQIGDFRFGVYQDTDHQLGHDNPTASATGGPATWGQAHGLFRGDGGNPAGAAGDHGWFVRVPIDDPATTNFDQLSENIGRINEETNDAGDSSPQIMNGTTDFVAKPSSHFSGTSPFPTNGIGIDKVYNFSLSLKRYDDPATAGNSGDAIYSTLTITERSSGQQWSFGDFDSVGVASGGDPDGGFESDAWDYFVMQTGGATNSDDFDWLIDNFKVELFGSNAGVNGDFNNDGKVNAADYPTWRKSDGTGGGYAAWRENFSTSSGSESTLEGSAVPEPGSAVLLLVSAFIIFSARSGKGATKSGRRLN
jgi:hypothetical protein